MDRRLNESIGKYTVTELEVYLEIINKLNNDLNRSI